MLSVGNACGLMLISPFNWGLKGRLAVKDDFENHKERMSFDTTQWSVVISAGRGSSTEKDEALSKLCRDYWYPLYVYVRRKVGDADKAADLTQAFFAKLLEKNFVSAANSAKGRFRAFLLTALKRFIANEWSKEQAKKRGGGLRRFSLDFDEGERRYSLESIGQLSPERIYQRIWGKELLDRVMRNLQKEFANSGKTRVFDQLKVFIVPQTESVNYSNVASSLGISAGAARVAANRIRRRYRELLRETIAQTVSNDEEIDEEIRSLFEAFGR